MRDLILRDNNLDVGPVIIMKSFSLVCMKKKKINNMKYLSKKLMIYGMNLQQVPKVKKERNKKLLKKKKLKC